MADRYSRILSAAKYYAAIDNYIKYITDSAKRGSRVGQGKSRPESIPLFIIPFGMDLGTGKHLPVSASTNAWNSYQGSFTGYTKATGVTEENKFPKISGFRAARANIVTGRQATGVAKTSAVTGMKYLDYGGQSQSIPFGKGATNTTQTAAFEDIKTKLGAAAKVYLIPEKL